MSQKELRITFRELALSKDDYRNYLTMAEDVELSSQQTEKLLQFQDLTGIEDIERCRNILESHNWDLEVATQVTLNMREGAPSVYRPLPRTPPSVVASPPDQRVFLAVRSWQPTGLLGWSFLFISFPFQFVYSALVRLARYALSFIRADPRRTVTDPIRDVTTFIEQFEETYGTEHPIFYRGTYYQAVNDAKQDLKFLLVYLHGDDHQDTDEFCRTVLCNPEVVNFVNSSFLFWACSVNTSEGYRVSQALRENTYPFLAVIVLRENRMTVVARLEGPTEPELLIRRLRLIINDNEASLIAARLERHERSVNQSIRQQQDEAYKESLRADQEKERRRREEQELKARLEMEERNKILEEQRRKEEIRRQKIELADQIPEEPAEDHPSTIRLMIKLPNGTRLVRRFSRDDSLKFLYYFVFCHDESPDSFQIVTNFPRRVVPCEPTAQCPDPPTFAEFGLGKSEMLFVQDLEA
ncbi:FAS-associated factor 2-like isoform X2 [Stegodyphus dumicola]|uniref:FAS-associated factor 2-like isoform X2 n=1 Tax=Stegodyphus dumicola TaxID=202533 RepID=UPI0015AF35BC|nr:FAS-associated factor 2-like isoform X2 [Stegodyphus dumicola]